MSEMGFMKSLVDVRLGENVAIRDNVDLYKCEIGDGTKIKPFVVIEEGVKIGKNCKVGPFVYIPEGVIIGDNVFVGAFVAFTNDKYPRATNADGSAKSKKDWTLLKTHVKRGACIGAGATILAGITIGENALIAAGAIVTKDVPACKAVRGTPAQVVGDAPDLKKKA